MDELKSPKSVPFSKGILPETSMFVNKLQGVSYKKLVYKKSIN